MGLFTLIVCVSLAACARETQPALIANDINVTAPVPGTHMSAGYLSFTNNTADTIHISRIESPEFEAVEMHESTLAIGVAKMRRIEELTIPANATLSLQRGGKHLMLMRPTGALDSISLRFYNGDMLLLVVHTNVTPGNY